MANEYKQPFAVASHDQRNLIAGVFGDGIGGSEAAKANAKLIAAAPETAAERDRLRDALLKIDANAAESPEWIHRVAREGLGDSPAPFVEGLNASHGALAAALAGLLAFSEQHLKPSMGGNAFETSLAVVAARVAIANAGNV